jgi:hypothetical protein
MLIVDVNTDETLIALGGNVLGLEGVAARLDAFFDPVVRLGIGVTPPLAIEASDHVARVITGLEPFDR